MTTITLKINERTNFGKTFLAFIRTLSATDKNVEVIIPTSAKEKKTPNAETLKAIRDIENGIGISKAKNTTELIKKLKA
ncbi:MAG: hypothetical protein K0B10_05190 [Vicingaceae bacterium]|nr:hypothetical protein [Vicingaceae bacterium]